MVERSDVEPLGRVNVIVLLAKVKSKLGPLEVLILILFSFVNVSSSTSRQPVLAPVNFSANPIIVATSDASMDV